jgi:hypothetical protein
MNGVPVDGESMISVGVYYAGSWAFPHMTVLRNTDFRVELENLVRVQTRLWIPWSAT